MKITVFIISFGWDDDNGLSILEAYLNNNQYLTIFNHRSDLFQPLFEFCNL